MTTKYDKEILKWLLKIYKKSIHWVPAYLRDVFTPGSENMNSFFDGYVYVITPLNEVTVQ